MKKAVFVIPYFGKFKPYFQLFLNSCNNNQDFEWLIFTDNRFEYHYPLNVHVHYFTFEEMCKFIQKKFDFKLKLLFPYKLCDFKPAYGYIFEEYISEYSFWGHCDTDLIFGDINKFIQKSDWEQYDKLFVLGHCTLYKNSYISNRYFMKPLDGKLRFKEVFTSAINHSFDEEFKESINSIYNQYEISCLTKDYSANIYTKSSNFRLIKWDYNTKCYVIEKKKKAFFVWDKGSLYRYIKIGKDILKEEYLYIHLQGREMKTGVSDTENSYKIIPNAFEKIESYPITSENFRKIRIKHFNLHYFKLRFRNLTIKLKRWNKKLWK